MNEFSSITGDTEIDRVIASLRKTLGAYRSANEASGQCRYAAEDVVRVFREAGFDAWMPVAVQERDSSERWETTPEIFGYVDRSITGWPTHYWACVRAHDGTVYGLDFTAAQYGYTEHFPMAQKSNRSAWAARRVARRHLKTPREIRELQVACSPEHWTWADNHEDYIQGSHWAA